jgi:WD40 repeat protein
MRDCFTHGDFERRGWGRGRALAVTQHNHGCKKRREEMRLKIFFFVISIVCLVVSRLSAQTAESSKQQSAFEIGQHLFQEVGVVNLDAGEKAGLLMMIPDGRTLLIRTASATGTKKKKEEIVNQTALRAYELPSLKPRFVRQQNAYMVFNGGRPIATTRDSLFSPDGRYLVLYEKEHKMGLVRLLETVTGRTKNEITRTKKDPRSISIDGEKHQLAYVEGQWPDDTTTKPVKIYDLFSGREIKSLDPLEIENKCGFFSDLKTCGTTSADPIEQLYFLPRIGLLTTTLFGKAYVWDVEKGEIKRQLVNTGNSELARDRKATYQYLTDLALTPQEDILALSDRTGSVSFWNAPRMDFWYETPVLFRGGASRVSFSANGNLALITGWEGSLGAWGEKPVNEWSLVLWDVRNQRLLGKTLLYPTNRAFGWNNFFLTPDEKYLVVRRYNKDYVPGEMVVFSVTNQGLNRVAMTVPSFSHAIFSNDGSLFCLITEDQEKVVCYDVRVKVASN